MRRGITEQEAGTQASTGVRKLGGQGWGLSEQGPRDSCKTSATVQPPSLYPLQSGLEASLPPGSEWEQTRVMDSNLLSRSAWK